MVPPGPELPNVEISYKNLEYKLLLPKSTVSRDIESVWDKYFELITLPFQIAKAVWTKVQGAGSSNMTELTVLKDIDGRLKPGMYLDSRL